MRLRLGCGSGSPAPQTCSGALLLRDRASSAGRYNGDLSAGNSSPSAPRTILTWVLVELRQSLIVTGVLWFVGPARFAPSLRFGDASQNRKAATQHRANRMSCHIGDVAQAEVADIATGVMLSLSIRGVLVGRGALRRQA